MSVLIEPGAVVLFQGDSITDCGRSRADGGDLGHGYALMAAGWFLSLRPESKVTFLNRGIGGNVVADLKARWQADCIDLRPNWVSIMVGINETGRRFSRDDITSAESYESDYRDILTRAREQLEARFILMEPFVLPVPPDRARWREDLDPRIHVVRRLAREFDALLVPLDGLFAQAAARREPAFWAPDGVHPTPAGHALMARAWLEAVGAL
jgi:lysophospholipase L1-like esterase